MQGVVQVTCWCIAHNAAAGVLGVLEPPPLGRWLVRAAGAWQIAQLVLRLSVAVQLVVS